MRKNFYVVTRDENNEYSYVILRERKNRKKATDCVLAKGLNPVAILDEKEAASLSAAFETESAVDWLNANYQLFSDDDVMDHIIWSQKWIEEWLKS